MREREFRCLAHSRQLERRALQKGEELRRGTFRQIANCKDLRRAINEGGYDYVVVTPRIRREEAAALIAGGGVHYSEATDALRRFVLRVLGKLAKNGEREETLRDTLLAFLGHKEASSRLPDGAVRGFHLGLTVLLPIDAVGENTNARPPLPGEAWT